MTMKADVGMQVKMNNKCFPEIVELEKGNAIDESGILALIAFVNERHDCADFRTLPLIKTYISYRELVSKPTATKIKDCLLAFKYWMDEPGIDGMCYWSENHQLIFHTAEYLAGNLFPEDTFTNNGMSGREHCEKAAPKIRRWLAQKFRHGFIEWNSNTYYEEDIAPLALLVDHAPDADIRENAKTIIDLLLLDMAMHSFEGYFVATSGRCYETQKQHPESADVNDILKHAFGIIDHDYDHTRLSTLFLLCRGYQVPEILRKIAKSPDTMLIKASQGHDLAEAVHAIQPRDFDNLGMYLWQMEAFTNPESIEMTIDIFNAWKLMQNNFLKDLRMVNIPLLRKLRLLPLLVKLLNPATSGVAIERANIYTWRTKHYLLSSVQRYHPGKFGDQQHIWQATLPGKLTLFSTHPGSPMFDDQARNFSPSYWVGNGINPDARQYENILLLDYDLNKRKGFLERLRQAFVHFYFPKDRYDEVIFHDRAIYARKQTAYVAIIADSLYEVREEELLFPGRRMGFAVVMGESDESDFQAFIAANPSSALIRRGKILEYACDKVLSLRYNRDFIVDGNRHNPDFNRFDTPFVHAEREPKMIVLDHAGLTYEMTFAAEAASAKGNDDER